MHTAIYPETERRPDELPLAERDCRRGCSCRSNGTWRIAEYFVGTELSVADFIGAFTLDWADEAGFLDRSPGLKMFVQRMYERDTAPPTIRESFAALQRGTPAPKFRGDGPATLP